MSKMKKVGVHKTQLFLAKCINLKVTKFKLSLFWKFIELFSTLRLNKWLIECFVSIPIYRQRQEEEENHQSEIHWRWRIEQDQTNLDT